MVSTRRHTLNCSVVLNTSSITCLERLAMVMKLNVTSEQFDTVRKLDHWEYDYYTLCSSSDAAEYCKFRYGNFTTELGSRYEQVGDGSRAVKYLHNIAHDGSLPGLVSLLSDFIDLGQVWVQRWRSKCTRIRARTIVET